MAREGGHSMGGRVTAFCPFLLRGFPLKFRNPCVCHMPSMSTTPVIQKQTSQDAVSRTLQSERWTQQATSGQGGRCREGQGQGLGEEEAQDVRKGRGAPGVYERNSPAHASCSSFRADQACRSDDPRRAYLPLPRLLAFPESCGSEQ